MNKKIKNINYDSNQIEPVIYNEDSPNKSEAIKGLLLGLGYLTVLVYIPYIILGIIFPPTDDLSANLLSLIAQLITGVAVILLDGVISRRMLPTIKANINRDNIRQGLITAVVMYCLALLVNAAEILIFKDTVSSANQEFLLDLANDFPILLFVFTAIVAPIVEEMIFRYYLFGTLRKKTKFIVALLISTLAFALIHFTASALSGTLLEDLKSLPQYVVPALALGYCYYRSDSIVTPIVAHMSYNAFNILVVLISTAFELGV